MRIKNLADLNKLRKKEYFKDENQEKFLLEINKILQKKEQHEYLNDYKEIHPFIFIHGVPRSGTTILAQVIANSFDIGNINNFIARFWLAPITGIKLSKIIYSDLKTIEYKSNYASTAEINNIHEFGYFWRYWLKTDVINNCLNAKKIEKSIDWEGLKKTLLNMQMVFNKGICMKNLFGAYHVHKFFKIFEKVLFVYIERDPLDNAISILEARKKFYNDLNTWWSIIPQEYNRLKDLPYMDQIAGQVHFLQKLYNKQIEYQQNNGILKITYKELCESPSNILEKVRLVCKNNFGYDLRVISKPEPFKFKTYQDIRLKEEFNKSFKKFEK